MPSASVKVSISSEFLTRRDLTADDPIERAAVEQFLPALGNHARDVQRHLPFAALAPLGDPLADPLLEVFDQFGADA